MFRGTDLQLPGRSAGAMSKEQHRKTEDLLGSKKRIPAFNETDPCSLAYVSTWIIKRCGAPPMEVLHHAYSAHFDSVLRSRVAT